MADADDWTHRSIGQIAAGVQHGEVSAEAVAAAFLRRYEAIEPQVHAFLHLQSARVVEQARAIDAKRVRNEALGPLAGVPIAVKDSLCTIDAPTSCGSRILARDGAVWQPPYDATVVEKLRSADAVLMGKTNLDEFAMGSSTESSASGPTLNPWDLGRVPGGSSGGSAVAVACRMSAGALGSDTGGSIRQPAAFTHTVGLKPTYGRVSRYGLVAYASSLDQVGSFGSDVRGAARILEVIGGHDPRDATSATAPMEKLEAACGRDVRSIRIGVPEEYFGEGLDAAVEQRVRRAIEALRGAGCTVHAVHLPHTRYAIATYYILATAEASSNLARFDGVRFGLRVHPQRGDLEAMYTSTRSTGFGAEVKRRIMLGTYVLSAGYYDAYYLKAQKVRTLLRRDFDEAFRQVDVIAAPASPIPPWKLGEKLDDPLSMYLADIYTLPASLAGLPAISVPCEPTQDGLPVGLQLIAPAFQEARLCAVASAWEAMNPARGLVAPHAHVAAG
ncbi:MAG: Asp-tRNA(Asn)/Glu-tRNA(Gln) amidotransferase subunit GatA [Deltaproteobacteria bacterium]|nr:Asp-tRNA(Asn)/Glu-tRNA(Gln) amidotransferase subunit GatA [Deltaproteobacteria bacterium]